MTAFYPMTFVMSAVLICKWTLGHYDDDDILMITGHVHN